MQETFSSSNTISIITPLFNRLDLIPETWESIKAQTYPHWEWIVVDDGSTDDGSRYIKALAKEDTRIKYFIRESGQKGPSRCRNIGVSQSSGDFLLFLDSDDIITATCLEERIKYMREHPTFDFAVFTQETFVHKPGDKGAIFNTFYQNKANYLNSFIADQHPWQTSGPLWKKEALKAIGGFREDYTIMEDPELHIRALIQGLQFEVVQSEPDFFYRLLPKTQEQEKQFWENSIKGRIVFFKDLHSYLIQKDISEKLRRSLQKGVINYLKTFLLSRSNQYPMAFAEFNMWLKQTKILPYNKIRLIGMYNQLNTKSYLQFIPFVKGFIFKML